MRVIILGGFLGSGKTTALLQMARYLVSRGGVVIIENEIGEVGVDDKFLRSGGLAVRNLFSGCACCTVSGDLTAAAREIREKENPEFLVIETTGVAYPLNMRENLAYALGVESRIAILADAARWNRLVGTLEGLIAGQLEGADAVLINKCDLSDEETLAKIEADILGLEPNAKIFRVSALSGIPDSVWGAATGV
ncbi:MAG: cobalamin biosynthesis protein P47K [Oscillospiraceae bacterium]|jgi:G3E family GTPase|nr:cobalamin biosynthesis protein P47K [Oscillospiraceae bacterium]